MSDPFDAALLPAETDPARCTPLWLTTEAGWPATRDTLPPSQRAWLAAQSFQGERHRVCPVPDERGSIAGVFVGLGGGTGTPRAISPSWWDAAALPERLPSGDYRIATGLDSRDATRCLLGWLLGMHRLNRFRSQPRHAPAVRLLAPANADVSYATHAAAALLSARDLINAPPNELGPLELAAAARTLSERTGGACQLTEGETLRRDFPLISAVGQGSARKPLLIDCRWPKPGAPRVTLVGKGVCFDSGGLDIKPPAGMLLMKKDMGGAACVLALAELLLAQGAPIELRVLIPAVENSVGDNAFRPGDVWPSRAGLTVEIGNTDAEGRLILADALSAADAERPDLLIDMATLTGAARTALGPDLPAVFGTDETLIQALRQAGDEEEDPLWPLPLWMGYDDELASRIADLNNVSASPFAGAIIGALFLKRFVVATDAWLHIDLFAWNPKDRPGRPQGAEAQCVRALYRAIRRRFG